MKTTNAERDPSLAVAYSGVAALGLAMVLGSASVFGVRTAIAVALGSALALTNLWTLERLVRAYLASDRRRWGAVALVKASILFGTVALLVKAGKVDVAPLVIGFGALPLGVVVSGLWPVPSAGRES